MDFRLFYNQNIHPELLHLEHRRRRLLRLILLTIVLLGVVAAVQLFIGVFLVTLLLFIPVGIWMAYLSFQIREFYRQFKPRIVGLLLDFIDNDVNFSFEGYVPEGCVAPDQFLESRIFTSADDYKGEDLILGQVRETPFEMSELTVKEFSMVRNRLDYVFRGVFLIGDFRRWDMRGGVLILPDAYRKYLNHSEKSFHLMGGRRVRNNLLPEFEAFFDTYATPDTRIQDVISVELQRAVLDFRQRFQEQNRQKEIYLSIIGDKIYIALTQDRNLLEPSIWQNNARFELIREQYEDLQMLLDVVKAVDVMN
jgi:uncharacterized membrane protein